MTNNIQTTNHNYANKDDNKTH